MKKYFTYSDMADECASNDARRKCDVVKKRVSEDVCTTTILIKSEEQAKALSRAKGKYVTVECTGLLVENANVVARAIRDGLKELASSTIYGRIKVLVVGLGNRFVTADALGALTADRINVGKRGFEVCSLSPGVYGMTGMESLDVIKGVQREIGAGLIIVADTLASAKPSRLFKTFQMTDAGLEPGSAAGAGRQRIDFKNTGVPVLAIGVPVCLYARSLIYDAVERATEGNIKPAKKYDVAFEVLGNENVSMILTPKEVDEQVVLCAKVISEGINMCFKV